MSIHRFLRFVLIGLVLLLALTPITVASANGTPPHRVRFPFGDPVVWDQCGFPVLWEALEDQTYIHDFTTPQGTFSVITGVLNSRLTNQISGKSISLRVAGNMKLNTYNDGTFVIKLHGPFVGFPGTPGLPAMAYIQGSQTVTFATDGTMEIKTTGEVVDLCAALGD